VQQSAAERKTLKQTETEVSGGKRETDSWESTNEE